MTSVQKSTNLGENTELVPGQRYRIFFEDCCIQGSFEARFVGVDVDVDGDVCKAE